MLVCFSCGSAETKVENKKKERRKEEKKKKKEEDAMETTDDECPDTQGESDCRLVLFRVKPCRVELYRATLVPSLLSASLVWFT